MEVRTGQIIAENVQLRFELFVLQHCLKSIYIFFFSFFQMAELSHSVISPMSFRVEYKRNGTGPAMFQRHVRFQVIIITTLIIIHARSDTACHNTHHDFITLKY